MVENVYKAIGKHAGAMPGGWAHDGNESRNNLEATSDLLYFMGGRFEAMARELDREALAIKNNNVVDIK